MHTVTNEPELIAQLRTSRVISGVDFRYKDLGERCLIGLTFRDCVFKHVDFSGSDLSLTDFIGCDLYGTKWHGSVLYTTRFTDCNLTKADLTGSFLLGFRARDVDITKAKLDAEPLVGMERKPLEEPEPASLFLTSGERLPHPAIGLEADGGSIWAQSVALGVRFIRVPDGDPRYHLRVAETAKYLRAACAANAYPALAGRYFVTEQRHRRRANRFTLGGVLRRAQDFLFSDVLWRYGQSPFRPIFAFMALALFLSAIVLVMPLFDSGSGYFQVGNVPVMWLGLGIDSLRAYGEVLYFMLVSPLSNTTGELRGWARPLLVAYLVSGVALFGLFVEAAMRRARTSNE